MDTAAPVETTLSFGELVKILWAGKWLIIVSTLVLSASAGFIAWLIPPTYSAQILLSPVASSSSGSGAGVLGAVAEQFAGAVGIGGLSSADAKKAESLAYLQSEWLTERFIKENNLLPILYKERWDPVRGAWKEAAPNRIPTLWKANRYFKKEVRKVVTDAKTGLVTLTMTWTDPQTAARWANEVVRMTNDYLRNIAIVESEKRITYLDEEAAKVSAMEARQAVYKVLQDELSKVVFAKGTEDYAFKVIDPAVPPERPSSLAPLDWAMIGGVSGLLLTIPFLLFRSKSARARTGSAPWVPDSLEPSF